MELLTGLGLATAAGLNAYIPLLALGLLSRFTDLVSLPHGYGWLENAEPALAKRFRRVSARAGRWMGAMRNDARWLLLAAPSG